MRDRTNHQTTAEIGKKIYKAENISGFLSGLKKIIYRAFVLQYLSVMPSYDKRCLMLIREFMQMLIRNTCNFQEFAICCKKKELFQFMMFRQIFGDITQILIISISNI